MRKAPAASDKATVLKNLTLSEETFSLGRKGRAREGGLAEPRDAEGLATPALPPAPNPAKIAQDAAYQEGLEQGRKVGHEQGRELGYKAGLEQGLQEGKDKGFKESLRLEQQARDALAASIQRLDALTNAITSQCNEQMTVRMQASEEDMVALCLTVVCRFLGEKLVSRETIAQAVRQAIQKCCGSGTQSALSSLLAVHVNPADLAVLQENPELLEWLKRNGAGSLPWIPDEQVRLGGCIVRSSQGSLDARLETQFEALREVLLQARSATLPPRGVA
jgi:flagellar assembly protein FliH